MTTTSTNIIRMVLLRSESQIMIVILITHQFRMAHIAILVIVIVIVTIDSRVLSADWSGFWRVLYGLWGMTGVWLRRYSSVVQR